MWGGHDKHTTVTDLATATSEFYRLWGKYSFCILEYIYIIGTCPAYLSNITFPITLQLMYTRYYNARFIDRGSILPISELYVNSNTGRICAPPQNLALVTRNINLRQQYLAPGFLDIQNNGVFGCNFLNLQDGELIQDFSSRYEAAMQKYLTTGVTSMCPTVTLSAPLVYAELLPTYHRSCVDSRTDSLGAHVEGPFISRKKKGCHPIEVLQPSAESDHLQSVYGGSDTQDWLENVCIVTAAPEIPGVLDIIPEITLHNVIFSIGHTEADQATAREAVLAGATMITHMYNAMPQPHHRESGVVGLISDPTIETPYYGLICDNHHVDPSMAVLALRANPDKCVLTTDAMHLLGLPDGSYKWGDQVIVKTGPVLYLEGTKTLAGAATTLPECVRNMVQWLLLTLAEVVKLCTNNAAASINLSHERGFLDQGCFADFVVLDNDGYVERVFKRNTEHGSSDINPRKTRDLQASL